jgi:hypothetical protein
MNPKGAGISALLARLTNPIGGFLNRLRLVEKVPKVFF